MARGFNMPRGGGANINQLMKQAQKMQADMAKMQEELNARTFSATAGGGAVKATVTGGKSLVSIELSEAAVDPDDIEMLQDLIVAAVNEALRTADETVAAEMNKVTGGLNLGF
ncbi:MAG: YbaB/EbfC family nucleoid-associated protein [Christensenellales bacterium]|jgi:DNA-binding YbaB/EbfC family protein